MDSSSEKTNNKYITNPISRITKKKEKNWMN